MATFALISEGPTDHPILARLVQLVCCDLFEEGVDINPLQPLRDASDAALSTRGGWELVLEYCEEKAADALAANDYVVIQIDTDQGDHPNFGVPLTENGCDRPLMELVSDAVAIIRERLGVACHADYIDRFVFAVCVHSIESWILLCLYDRDEPKNSLARLNRALRKSGLKPLTKEFKAYSEIAKAIKRKNVLAHCGQDHSLGMFIKRLSELTAQQ